MDEYARLKLFDAYCCIVRVRKSAKIAEHSLKMAALIWQSDYELHIIKQKLQRIRKYTGIC